MQIRTATVDDAAACADIYAPYVRDTAITFELIPPSAADMADRIAAARRAHEWLVAVDDSTVLGYAYASPYKERAAYQWACEVSVYLQRGYQRTGLGRALYNVLFDRLAKRGFRTLVAGMTLPNDASVGLHKALGFEPVGVWRAIGWKHDAWHDVAWCQRRIGPHTGPPSDLR